LNPKCLTILEQRCKTKRTFENYVYNLDLFLKYAHKDYDSLLLLPQIELDELLQEYCIFQKKRSENNQISPNSIPLFFNGIFKFLKVNKKKFDQDSITEMYPRRNKLGGDLAISTEQCKIMLNSTGDRRDKALIHFYCATGARPEAVCELQMKHVEMYQDGFYKIVLYEGDMSEMFTFLHPEASQSLTEYFEWRKSKGEVLNGESPVFRSNSYLASVSEPKLMVISVMHSVMYRLWKKIRN